MSAQRYIIFAALSAIALAGCSALPDVRHQQRYHNPFPQLHSVGVLPFRNQSEQPTLSGERVSLAYSHELQLVPGFEVLPVGVVENQLAAFEQNQLRRGISSPADFQAFAQYLGVDCVLQGAITDFDPYYPPRMTLAINWYSANPNFHPIPVGYGLPWGTKDEKKIPEYIKLEAERELATEQLKTQTPREPVESTFTNNDSIKKSSLVGTSVLKNKVDAAGYVTVVEAVQPQALETRSQQPAVISSLQISPIELVPLADQSPIQWPNPEGFIPPAPSEIPALALQSRGPIISHMFSYNGRDEDFTNELEDYFYFKDDARFGGWESYLQRSEDFIRFCCYLHIKQTLLSRGGQLKNRTVVRWPVGRYHQ